MWAPGSAAPASWRARPVGEGVAGDKATGAAVFRPGTCHVAGGRVHRTPAWGAACRPVASAHSASATSGRVWTIPPGDRGGVHTGPGKRSGGRGGCHLNTRCWGFLSKRMRQSLEDGAWGGREPGSRAWAAGGTEMAGPRAVSSPSSRGTEQRQKRGPRCGRTPERHRPPVARSGGSGEEGPVGTAGGGDTQWEAVPGLQTRWTPGEEFPRSARGCRRTLCHPAPRHSAACLQHALCTSGCRRLYEERVSSAGRSSELTGGRQTSPRPRKCENGVDTGHAGATSPPPPQTRSRKVTL